MSADVYDRRNYCTLTRSQRGHSVAEKRRFRQRTEHAGRGLGLKQTPLEPERSTADNATAERAVTADAGPRRREGIGGLAVGC